MLNIDLYLNDKNKNQLELLKNLKWWEDPYTFACVELKCMLDCKKVWYYDRTRPSYDKSVELLKILKEKFDNTAIYIEHNSQVFIKVSNYLAMNVNPYGNEINIYYNSHFKSKESIENLIEEIENYF